ncbi:hypothetical protein CTI16_02975 [Prevotella intermedia]|uniref:Uncharacterized protein n=1 Tax=Prevotella intermedia TaxID=28131 RepID=A0AAJ3V9H7_PREIN|nr:hypothetical protein CUB95_07005 [Prevotella intermedia]PIK18133.1 hypothetical protein CTI16_02975 [Prevotella intermedia]
MNNGVSILASSFDNKPNLPINCKYFLEAYVSYNSLSINTLQNLCFRIPKVALLHGKSVGFAL